MVFFLFVAGNVYFQWHGNKEKHWMEMWWCFMTLKYLCRFFLFEMCVLLDAEWLCGKGAAKRSALDKISQWATEGWATKQISNVVLAFHKQESRVF
jgi:hypothetical protein